jgi:hypothetical protein
MQHCFAIGLALALCAEVNLLAAGPKPVRVLVWDEQQPEQKQAYGAMFLGSKVSTQPRSIRRMSSFGGDI